MGNETPEAREILAAAEAGEGRTEDKGKRPFWKRYAFPLAVLALCLILAGYLVWNLNPKQKMPVIGPAPEFTLQDLDGNSVSLSGTNGKVRLLYFFFANCPDVCPPTTFLLSKVQDELKAKNLFGNKAEILSVTIDPQRDTPEALRAFAGNYHADFSGWKFLRGEEKATADLAAKYDVPVVKDDQGNFTHLNLFVLIDKEGKIRDYISANDYIENGSNNLPVSDIVQKIESLT
jgi:protein SCO1/2